MLVAVVLQTRQSTHETTRATFLAGVCPMCGLPLELFTPESADEVDAVCLACGGTVGRIIPQSYATEAGVVSVRGKPCQR